MDGGGGIESVVKFRICLKIKFVYYRKNIIIYYFKVEIIIIILVFFIVVFNIYIS